jgi:branched-chain amino acid transport system substrate-binding protein
MADERWWRPGRRPAAAVALLLATGLIMTACGARVGPYLGAGAGFGGSGSGGSSQTTTPGAQSQSTTPGSAAGGGGGATAGGGGGGGSGANPSVAPASGFDFKPATEAAACQGSAGNTASAPGISANSILIGNVSGISGPLQGSFTQGRDGVAALFDAVNAAGGICGRKLLFDAEDDGQNSSTNKSDVDDLISKPVFAFAGSTSDADNGGVQDMINAGVPDFGFAINCVRSQSPVYWSVDGGSCYQPGGPGTTFYIGDGTPALAQSEGYLPKTMAFLAYSIAISAQAAQQFAYVYTHTFGGTICYEDTSISPVSASLESDVSQMQAKGCQGVYTTLDVTGNAKLLQAMQQQNFQMPYVGTTFDGYTPAQISTAGQSAAQGLIVSLPFIPLNENQPMDVMYQQQLQQYVPGSQPSGFGFLSWLAAQMMIYTLLQAGRNPTHASLNAALNALKNFDAGGAVGPYTPSNHSLGNCVMDTVVKGNDFVRKAPSSGLFCNTKIVPASGPNGQS